MTSKYDVNKIHELSEAEKFRMIVILLNHNEPNNVDWDTIIAQTGSKSKASMKVMYNKTLRNLKKAESSGDDGNGEGTPKTHKRTADDDATTPGTASPEAETPSPTKKRKSIPKKAQVKTEEF
ncbi:uncharacterized protein K452DRAFT_332993 [Aplosporella prunicola CBS 121167]|uniref:Myb-like domain-containing protein n=1 Tax=Aplosporella prunicola CBS 121167 TaxID=1176127 RepID=A0A6A6BDC0_9PEZI|nr:uncharacterized protein K452DRAFT_332993 [Aplosporella prunicola CBS 121167]KAF2142182.1 hypothetical protein K452DRAFT_332993 [Aplosporella prunicola CBS 121167]